LERRESPSLSLAFTDTGFVVDLNGLKRRGWVWMGWGVKFLPTNPNFIFCNILPFEASLLGFSNRIFIYAIQDRAFSIFDSVRHIKLPRMFILHIT
jgi:hypothetical protein